MIILLLLFAPPALAQESEIKLSEIQLPEVLVEGSASFETLRKDSYVPARSVGFEVPSGRTLDPLQYSTNFPPQNLGVPSGASTINLGGRSTQDTQVTTLGIPLNLPQGGGADLSSFPSFLWKRAILSPTLSTSGFTPNAASGSIEFIPWTREKLRDSRSHPLSRFTATYDRQLQTLSLATRKDTIAILGGMTAGLMEGPAGEASFAFYRSNQSQWTAHVIGTDQKGEAPFRARGSEKRYWRVLPVLESRHRLDAETVLESTFYGDLSTMTFTDPADANESDTRTEQYGVENALVHGPYTFSLSGRYTMFIDGSRTHLHEWPVFGSISREIDLTTSTLLKATLNSNYNQNMGLAPGGKLSFRFSKDSSTFPFAEINTIAKIPTLIDRFAVYPGYYQGNPNLNPERIYSALVGYQRKSKSFFSRTILKLEQRESVIVSTADYLSMRNAGGARLASLEQENKIPLASWISLQSNLLFTASELADTQLPYPDVPFFGGRGLMSIVPSDRFIFDSGVRYMGPSTTSSRGFHAPYTFFDESISYEIDRDVWISAGVTDVFDQRSELVVGFPTPGRMVNLAFTAEF